MKFNLGFPALKKAKNELAEVRMEMGDFGKLINGFVLPYEVESLLYVEETGYSRRFSVDDRENVIMSEYEECMLNRVFRPVGESKVGCVIGVTVLVNDYFYDPLEDLDGGL